ncbi:hypothetical protein J4214_01750 [Candidatus Woesearchaeota archaeon]|nr:hypothetical protein [Candidatus Woesearchaeota archaeon]
MFRKRYPPNAYHHAPKGYYLYPYKRHNSGIIFLFIFLIISYVLQLKGYLPNQEIVPFWFLALMIIAVFFLFKRKEGHY